MAVVLEWLKGETSIAELCRKQGISDTLYYKWRDQFIEACGILDIEQVFTSYDNPKGNADTERVIRTIKEEAIWPYEHETLDAAAEMLAKTRAYYNTAYCHSALNYLSPMEFEAQFFQNQMQRAA